MKTIAKLNQQDRLPLVDAAVERAMEVKRIKASNAELLAALEVLVDWTYNQSNPLESIREQAQQAMAKAKGEVVP